MVLYSHFSMNNTEPYKLQVVAGHRDTRKPLPMNSKYPKYESLDAFPVLGAIDFWGRNRNLKKQYVVADSALDITKKVAFYTAHAAVLVGSFAMAIEPVREKIFDVVEKFGNYFM